MSDSEDRVMLNAVRALLLDECNEAHPDGPQKYGQIENPYEGDAQRLAEIAEAVGGWRILGWPKEQDLANRILREEMTDPNQQAEIM
jgi:hypothetical protein